MLPVESAGLRYLVLLPSTDRPVGGVNILLWLIEALGAAGYRIAALHGRRDYTYGFQEFRGESLYSPELDRMFRTGFFRPGLRKAARQALRDWPARLARRGGRRRLPVWHPEPQDVLIVPEYLYPEAVATFGDRRCILAVQDVFGLLRASLRSRRWQGGPPETFSALFSTSQASAGAAETLFHHAVPAFRLPVCRRELTFNPDKKLQIALMPRKRGDEARILKSLIQAHPVLADIPLVVIDRIPSQPEVHRLMRESLIFLSLSYREGFGLPPAEAMATGSLVIGYTGVGGAEFFTPETGFPIADSDIIAILDCLAEVVETWRRAPEALERKRRRASEFIWSHYDEDQARTSLLDLWGRIDADMRAQQTL